LRTMASIDRFEKDLAVLVFFKTDDIYSIPRKFLPVNCKEGDILNIEINVEKNKTKDKLKDVSDLIKKLKDENEF